MNYHVNHTKTNVPNLNLNTSWRKAFVPAGIKPELAYSLCKFADIKEGEVVYDPFCGSSTIPIIAALNFPVKRVISSDISGSAIDASQKNFDESGLSKDRYVLFRSNISMVKLRKSSIDKVITNPPWGIRSGKHEKNIKVYNAFAKKLNSVLKDNGLAVVITQEKKLIYEAMKDYFGVTKETEVVVDGLHLGVYRVHY